MLSQTFSRAAAASPARRCVINEVMIAFTACDDFLEIIARPDRDIDLAGAALLIARDEYPDLDVDAYRSRLERMALEVAPRIDVARGNPFAAIDALKTYLFVEQRLRGNHEEYFDPRNSYLNDVIDRRRGIPITLSVVYLEVSARAGFPVEGVGFPGHFLVRHAAAGREILIDPFHRGEILLPEDCRRRLAAVHGGEVALEARFFETTGNRAILKRMLQNLKQVYLQAKDYARALRTVERLVALAPDDPHHAKDRAQANAGLTPYAPAAADLERYLALAPSAGHACQARKHIKSPRRLAATLN